MPGLPSKTLALTGATGFIGGNLIRRLIQQGWRVRALVREGSQDRFPAEPGTERIVGDLADTGALEQLVAGVDVVIHAAAAVRGWEATFQEANVVGTRRLVRAAARQQVAPRFLLISSLAAREPQLSAYAASKRGAEDTLAQESGDMSWTVLRPPAVYGPGDRELLPLFTWMARGFAPVLGTPGARFSLLYVDDLADSIVQMIAEPHATGAVHEVHDGHPGGYGWDDVIGTIESLSGRRARRIRIPAPLVSSVAALNLVARRALGSAPMLTPGKVRELTHQDWVCKDGTLCRATAWRPRIGLEEGLRRTLGHPTLLPLGRPRSND